MIDPDVLQLLLAAAGGFGAGWLARGLSTGIWNPAREQA